MAWMSERKAAKAMRRSRATLQAARADGRLVESVRKRGGRIQIEPVLARRELEENTVANGNDASTQAWRAARARLAQAKATAAEDELRRRRGELVDAAAVQARIFTVFANCRNRLLGVPSKARQRDPTLTLEQVALIDELLREALADLAEGRDEVEEGR